MAKLEARFDVSRSGGFDAVLRTLHDEILNGSISASYEDGSDYRGADNTRVAVRVYERFSWLGGNRVSLNLTLVGSGEHLFLTVITSGGSQAMFFKLNTFGEQSFLDSIRRTVDRLGGR